MIKVLIPTDDEFNYNECKNLYGFNKSLINDDASFDEIIQNTLFYSFYDDNILSLCVYFFFLKNKMWVNGYGIRKHHLYNKKCFQTALKWFSCDIWANTPHRPVKFALLRCGFKKYKDDIYVFRQQRDNTLS